MFEACTILLDAQEGLLTQLAAANALRALIDDWDFIPQQLSPHLASIVTSVTALLANLGQQSSGDMDNDAAENEVPMKVLLTLSLIIERMDQEILPFVSLIAGDATHRGVLFQLWCDCPEDMWLFRGTLLHVLTKLVVVPFSILV